MVQLDAAIARLTERPEGEGAVIGQGAEDEAGCHGSESSRVVRYRSSAMLRAVQDERSSEYAHPCVVSGPILCRRVEPVAASA